MPIPIPYHDPVEHSNPVASRIEEALEGVMSLLNPGAYGVSAQDPKARLIEDLTGVVSGMRVKPVIIDGIAVIVNGLKRQTIDVDLLVARSEAVGLIRRLEAAGHFSRIRIDRYRHNPTGACLDLCIEGEVTSPRHADRFPSPEQVERLEAEPLPVVGLIDLLALKVKSARAQDEVDFIRLYKDLGLGPPEIERIRSKVVDPQLRDMIDRWRDRAKEEIERDRLMKPPSLE